METAYVTGTATLANGEYDVSEREMATSVVVEALHAAGLTPGDVDGLYAPKPRPWAPQGLFTTYLTNRLGLELDRTVEVYTGGTSGGNAFRTAVMDVRAGAVDVAIVVAVERNSTIETGRYFEYALNLFDWEFQVPAGPTIPGVYAQSLQRYCHDYDVPREAVASIVVKNRRNAAANPEALFDDPVSVEDVLDSAAVADPLRLYECPAPCDGAAALVVSAADSAPVTDRVSSTRGAASTDRRSAVDDPVAIVGVGAHHATSHLIGPRDAPLSTMPAIGGAVDDALGDADVSVEEIDVFEPYAPFPHVEAIFTEEIGRFERGEGAGACAAGETAVDGATPVSPSGGCLGRGHPAMVTPLSNHVEAVRQLRGTAANQVADAAFALTTSEHGHVDGATATVFAGSGVGG